MRGYPERVAPSEKGGSNPGGNYQVILVPVCAVHKMKPTSKIEFLLRRVESRIAKSVFVFPNQTSLNGFKTRAAKSNLIHFLLCFVELGFFPWVSSLGYSFETTFVQTTFLLVFLSHFYSVFLRFLAVIYHFTK